MINMAELLTGNPRLVAHVTRFAGTPTHRRESVAEHSYMTTQYALFIGWHCRDVGARVDMEKLLSRAIVHDLDEAVMIDLPRPIKYADAELRQRWKVLCHRVIQEMSTRLGITFFHSWLDAKDDSLEGQILVLADLIAVTSYAIEELRFGNTYMSDVLQGNIAYLEQFITGDMTELPHGAANELIDLAVSAVAVARQYLPETLRLGSVPCPQQLT